MQDATVGLSRRKTPEAKAAAKAEREARKAEFRAQWEAAKERTEWRQRRFAKILATLQPDEPVEAEFLTAGTLIKKYLVFTSRRLLVSRGGDHIESIPYRAINSFTTRNLITLDVVLRIADRKDELELLFGDEADRDRARDILTRHAI